MDDPLIEAAAEAAEWMGGVRTYIGAQITPELAVYGLSAVIGAGSAVAAVAVYRDLVRQGR